MGQTTMRAYILTDRERRIIREYLRAPDDLSKKEYDGWCQIKHQYKKHSETIRQDLELLEQVMKASQ